MDKVPDTRKTVFPEDQYLHQPNLGLITLSKNKSAQPTCILGECIQRQ